MAGRPAKTLVQHVQECTFVARKHEHLLDADATFDTRAFHSLRLTYWMPLLNVVLWYRHQARDDAERRRAALAFEKAVHEDYGRYGALMGGKRWTQDAKGRWELKQADREADYNGFMAELDEGTDALRDTKASRETSPSLSPQRHGSTAATSKDSSKSRCSSECSEHQRGRRRCQCGMRLDCAGRDGLERQRASAGGAQA
jgi:hypothetical protein